MEGHLEDVPASGGEDAITSPHAEARVLFIPDAPSKGTSERTPTMLAMLRERHPVATLPATLDRWIYDPTRSRLPRGVLYVLDKILLGLHGLRVAQRFRATLVFADTVHHAVAGIWIARMRGIPCVWDSHGNGKLFYQSLGKGGLSTRFVQLLEGFVGSRVDALVTVSEVDASAYADMGIPRARIHVVPLCVRLPDGPTPEPVRRNAPGGSKSSTLLFFGSFGYAPNREALEFINDRLAPFLERRGVPCELRVAGRELPDREYHPSVRPLGFVPDIGSEIRGADLCVVPVRRGVGTLTKVIDAMAAGTPVVLFDFATRGIPEIRPGVDAYVAHTEDEFLERVVEALSHPEAAQAMARSARRLVERNYEWRSCADRLAAALWASARAAPVEVGHAG